MLTSTLIQDRLILYSLSLVRVKVGPCKYLSPREGDLTHPKRTPSSF